ncbi:serine/threonine-protein kinase TNNI3K, partial [Thraustotheca clavata]
DGSTPLYIAAKNGHRDTVSILIDAGDNINQATDNGATPLCIAAQNGHHYAVSTLIDAGADVNQAMKDGSTPLHFAAQNGHSETVSALIAAGANINQVDKNGATPLHIAVNYGKYSVAALLIECKADVNILDGKGKSALVVAAAMNYYNIVSLLLEANADTELLENYDIMSVASKTATHMLTSEALQKLYEAQIIYATKTGNSSQLQDLISKLSDPNLKDKDGNSLLHLAVQYNHPSVLQLLLQSPSIERNSVNQKYETALVFSIKSNNRSLTQMLYKADSKAVQFIQNHQLDFDGKDWLGGGAFGDVYKAMYQNEIVAVKRIRLNPQVTTDNFKREMDAMLQCRSPYLLELLAVSDLDTNEPKLVLQYMDGGDLRSYLNKKRAKLPTSINYSALEIAWVIANGLADIHQNGFIHRDLKSYNILLSSKYYIKLADFGLTRNASKSMTQATGTLSWTAPEILKGRHYGFSADIYSFGVVLTELDTLEMPYFNIEITPLKFLKGVCSGKLRPVVSGECPAWYKKLVEKCLANDPKKRPTALEIVDIIYDRISVGKEPEPELSSFKNFLPALFGQ